jgi:hypothetical protein
MAFMRVPYYILMQDGQVNINSCAHPEVAMTMSQEVFDMIVMMRYYNMTEEERRDAIGLVVDSQFETGADGVRKASGLSTVMERVDSS